MAVFSTNQNRQLYVAAGIENSLANIQGTSNLGKVYVGTDKDGCKYINQNGYGGIVRSDLIDPKNIMWARVTGPKDTQIVLKASKLVLDSNVNSGNPIAGQDYIVRVNFRQLYGMSDEDIYQKYGAVHATSTSPTNFYKEMAYSLFKNFNRVYSPLLYVGICDGSGYSIIKSASKNGSTITFSFYSQSEISTVASTDVTSPTGIIIAEQSQVGDWALGTKQYTPVYFDVIPTTITANSQEVVWGTVSDFTDTYGQAVGNGYRYADLEYFCMGERGDQYRGVGFPNNITTKYFVNPASTYYSLDIQYAYKGTCEDIQNSEKTLTILATSKATINSIVTALGIGTIVQDTDRFDDNELGSDFTYPKKSSEQSAIEDLQGRVETLETPATPGTGG